MNWRKDSAALEQIWDEGEGFCPDALDGEWTVEMATGPVWAFRYHKKKIEDGRGKNITTLFGIIPIPWGKFGTVYNDGETGLLYDHWFVDELREDNQMEKSDFFGQSIPTRPTRRILGRFGISLFWPLWKRKGKQRRVFTWFLGYFWMTRVIDYGEE